ncbi:hypothetical protein [Endozoicomonas atrinae]|uniref:hypothetical protein n=1 Tax=Endozoicomonas atrinae TaxID=1333660 RepID=UPI003B0085A0
MTTKKHNHEADICDVLAHIYGVDQNETDVMDYIDLYVQEKGISPYGFASELIQKLLPMADIGQSPIDESYFRCFSVKDEARGYSTALA